MLNIRTNLAVNPVKWDRIQYNESIKSVWMGVSRLRWPGQSLWGGPAAKERSAGRFQAVTRVLKDGPVTKTGKSPVKVTRHGDHPGHYD